jgi:hypothetical protein
MFERYTEKARRVIFFARYEASEFGSPGIETEHILLGLLREDKALAHRFLPSVDSVESIRQRIRALTPVREKISTSVDLPLSHESKRVLAYAAEAVELLNHRHIGTEHLFLGLLREEKSLAASLLREHGLSLQSVREELAAHGGESSTGDGLHIKLLTYLESLPNELGVEDAPPGIYVKADRSSATTPFLWIEALAPSVTLQGLRHRIEQRFSMGLRYLWLFDPSSRYVYVATPEAGLQEFKGDVLRTENPVLELPLAEVFA